MADGLESSGGKATEPGDAARQIEDTAAEFAIEVVMVRLAGWFIARRLPRQDNGHDLASLQHSSDIAIDRGDAESGNIHLRGFHEFLNRERSAALVDDGGENTCLFGLAVGGILACSIHDSDLSF